MTCHSHALTKQKLCVSNPGGWPKLITLSFFLVHSAETKLMAAHGNPWQPTATHGSPQDLGCDFDDFSNPSWHTVWQERMPRTSQRTFSWKKYSSACCSLRLSFFASIPFKVWATSLAMRTSPQTYRCPSSLCKRLHTLVSNLLWRMSWT